MADRIHRAESRWTWRLSAHCRIASLAALWAVLVFMAPLGWLFAPIAGIRSGLSFGQAFLNVRLGRNEPLEKQDRLDWLLVGGVVVAAYVVAGIGQVTGDMTSPFLFVPLLLPFTVLQARMTRRSYAAANVQDLRPATLLRLEDYRRAAPGELRAA